MIVLLISAVVTFYWYQRTVVNKKPLFIRSIPAMDAIPEGVDRAVEMGKPLHYTPGGRAELIGQLVPMTLASLNIMRRVARECAEKGARLIISAPMSPEALPLMQSIVQEQYILADKAEAYRASDIRWHARQQVPWQAGVLGIFIREGVATNIMIGACAGDSVAVMVGAKEFGALNIGGTPRWIMTYIFAMVSDYAVIGDELYAASTKISQDPMSISNIGATDTIKWLLMGGILLLIIAGLAGLNVTNLLTM